MTEEDHQHKSPTNLSHFRYIRVGQVDKYNPDTNYASISLDNGYLAKDDDLIIIGGNTETYIHQKVKEIQYNSKFVKKTPRGTKDDQVKIEVKLDDAAIGEGSDKVYVFTDKTYEKKVYSL
jgi:hypothetical protein